MAQAQTDFLQTLRNILNTDVSCASWSNHGVIIHDPTIFERDYLNTIFGFASYSQFVFQLQVYGFEKISEIEFENTDFIPTLPSTYDVAPEDSHDEVVDGLRLGDASLHIDQNMHAAYSGGSDKLDDINQQQNSLVQEIGGMTSDMEQMNQALRFLKAQSEQYDALISEYNRRTRLLASDACS